MSQMNNKKTYIVPEVVQLPLEPMDTLLISGDAQNSPVKPGPFGAPARTLYI